MRRRVHVLLAAGMLFAACGGGGETTSSTTSESSATSVPSPPQAAERSATSTSVPGTPDSPTATTTPTTTVAGPDTTSSSLPATLVAPVSLLVVDADGAWVWSSSGTRRQVVDGAIASAIPDRVGGVLFQRAETGAWRSVHDPSSPDTASRRWVGVGAGQPILRLRRPGSGAEVVVEAPSDGTVELVDASIVDGQPTVAYLRTRYFTITRTDDWGPWRESAKAELVVRDLGSGDEQVLRTQDVGWEYGIHAPSLGAGIAAEAIEAYGEVADWVELLGFDGSRIEVDYRLPSCEGGCQLVADLAPTGAWLVSARTGVSGDSHIEVTAIDHRSGIEQMRTTIPVAQWTRLVSVDTADERTLVLTAASSAMSNPPQLARGDQGAWVQRLQTLLSEGDTYLVPDGVFGPRTEAALRAAQASAGHDATGVVDIATWDVLGGPYRVLNEPMLIEPDGSVHLLPLLIEPTPLLPNGDEPRITLWTGPEWEGVADTVDEIVLRPDGLGPYEFGADRSTVELWLTEALGPPEPAEGLLCACARWGCGVEEYLRWPSAGLQVGFADRTPTGETVPEQVLLAWTVSVDPWFPGTVHRPDSQSGWDGPDLDVVLRTESRIGLASTVAELELAEPSTMFGAWNEGTFMPVGFYVPHSSGEAVLEGDVDWRVVDAMQEALNVRGADLAVDGIAGPATLAAIEDFQAQRELSGVKAILDALGLDGPEPSARIVRLSAGDWFWELDWLEYDLDLL